MLELRAIKKDYPAGGNTVHALRGIDLAFRKSEFVSILGPSGCGKTTLLNIIGGLDQYTSGDLLIRGKSTKEFGDRDWDNYRNHSIGFVFQSYNLIPHQTILQNVELALTLSGVSKSERKKRAKEALEKVGLGSQLSKRPNTLSGGQMQRVAIARALVNNPDIILADEPTGALDSETSIQVMELLKEVAKDRLVIMVTHNPELAEAYSTRIVRMLDGKVVGDSAPVTYPESYSQPAKARWQRKSSMSFFTAFMLSLRNLFTKKGRTTLTAFAGSIGIIGIALIIAISQGMTDYIATVQEETLTSYPITIQQSTMDISGMMSAMVSAKNEEITHEADAVYRKDAMYNMVQAMMTVDERENDLAAFKAYLEEEMAKPQAEGSLSGAVTALSYSYDLGLMVYTKNVDGEIILSDSSQLAQQMLGGAAPAGSGMSMSMSAGSGVWQEMLSGKNGALVSDVVKNQYDLLYGSWPNSFDQVILIVDENSELSDITLYTMGLESGDELMSIIREVQTGELRDREMGRWDFADICAQDFRVVLNSACYAYDEQSGVYTDLRASEAGLRYLYNNALPLRVVGVARPNPNASTHMLADGIGYTSALTEYVLTQSAGSDAIRAQMENPAQDVLTGLPFRENSGSLADAEKAEALKAYVAAQDEAGRAEIYAAIKSIPSEEMLAASVQQAMNGMTRESMEETLRSALTAQMAMNEETISGYLAGMSDADLAEMMRGMVAEGVKKQYAAQVSAQLAAMDEAQLAAALTMELNACSDEQCAACYDEVMRFSDSTYEETLLKLGYINLNAPTAINIYASSFENKDIIEKAIADYNAGRDEQAQIKYTDLMGILMSSITIIINAISYVLIAFVAVSLIVSSIMIGVITLISVQERTKEIGILRAIGASKRNVSRMFSAETIIIGFTAGLIGVGLSALMCLPINKLIHALAGVNTINAQLPLSAAITLVIISMLLTVIAGMIPARSAARKDPVVALRTE